MGVPICSTDNYFIGWRPVASFAASLENITRHARSLLGNRLKIGKHIRNSSNLACSSNHGPNTFHARCIRALIELPVTSDGRIPLMQARHNLMRSRIRSNVALISSENLKFTDAKMPHAEFSEERTAGSTSTLVRRKSKSAVASAGISIFTALYLQQIL